MSAEEALLTIAEMSVGVAGFSAIVAAFTGQGPLTLKDRRRFVWLFACAFIAALLAFVPVLLRETSVSEAELWRYSSALMCVVWAIGATSWVAGEVRNRGADPAEPKGIWQGPASLVPSFLNFLFQFANATALFWEPSAAVYIGGTLIWLYVAALAFISIVLERSAA